MNVKIGHLIRSMLGINKRFNDMHRRVKALEEMLYRNQSMFDPSTVTTSEGQGTRLVIPFLSGGMGNQFFQIAAAYTLARRIKSRLAINYKLYAGVGQGSAPSAFKNTLYKNIEETEVMPEFIYKYSDHKFKTIPYLGSNLIQIEGYFQSSKYFDEYSEEIRHLFVFPPEATTKAMEFLAKDQRPTVGIHIRLGDYLKHPGLQAFSNDYYRKAVMKFPTDSRFIICSDNPKHAFEILQSFQPEVFEGGSETADMVLLSQCENLIMSNSTFSFWAYYLGKNKQTVIAPKYWFNPKVVGNHDDIYEKKWIKI